jgi:hypothetical protein
MGFTHLEIERNLCLGGYSPQIPVLSAFYLQLNLLNPPPPPKKNSWVRHWLRTHNYRLITQVKILCSVTSRKHIYNHKAFPPTGIGVCVCVCLFYIQRNEISVQALFIT